jgi:hypothetical protein
LSPCHFVCELEWKVEPTFTVEHLLQRHRIREAGGAIKRVSPELVFETVLALDLKTKWPRLGFVAEASAMPFDAANAVQLEFESDFYVLTDKTTNGWLESHLDVVDQFSPSERSQPRRAYGHKPDFEWDTALHVFNRLAERRWLHRVELETSIDYLATGLPKRADPFPDGTQYLDDASHWSVSFVIVLPVAPF